MCSGACGGRVKSGNDFRTVDRAPIGQQNLPMYARLSICLIALILTGCNGVSKNNGVTSNPVATLDGNWEFVATSTTNPGVATVIDVQLQSNVGPAGSYSGSALSLQGQPTFSPYDCQGTFDLDQVDSLALTTTSDGVQVTGTFTDGSAVYNLTGTASGQTTSTQTITGTYTSSAGTPTSCQGSGMFVAHPGGWLTGNYLGTSGALSGSTVSVTQS
jgi:hypothetical protein